MSLQGHNEQISAKQKNRHNDHISAKQKNTLMQKNLKVYREQVIKQEVIDLERVRTERKLNLEAKSLMQYLKFPTVDDRKQFRSESQPSSPKLLSKTHRNFSTPPSPIPRRGSLPNVTDLTTKNKQNETVNSPPSPLLSRKNHFHFCKDAQLSFTQASSPPRRGSMNDIIVPLSIHPPSTSPRRGSMGELPSSLLQRRRSNVPPLSPLCDKPLSAFTKSLSKRIQLRRTKSGSSVSPPESPRIGSLEEQFKSLESCRYLRRRGSLDVDVFDTQQNDVNED